MLCIPLGIVNLHASRIGRRKRKGEDVEVGI